MLDKRLKILLAIVIVLLLGRGLYVLVMKEGNIVEESNEQPEEVVVAEPMDIEITDLKGPKQKYTNKTLGFSFEFPDEVEYIGNNKENYFSFVNKECLKSEDCGTMGIYNKWLNYNVNLYNNGLCNQEYIDKQISHDTSTIDDVDIIDIESIKTIENKNFLIKELLYTSNYESPGTFMSSYVCLDNNNYLNIQGFSDVNIKDGGKFDSLHKEFQGIINSLELLSE